MKTLEENYKTWCALSGATPSGQSMKDMVLEVLGSCELLEQRAIRIDLDTYFKLLLEFNRRGIHFTNMTIGAKVGEAPAQPGEEFFLEDGDDDACDVEDD
jgi:18S rRNA (adenine1779-N6/adenine1780-N6)-dimethyltransferase